MTTIFRRSATAVVFVLIGSMAACSDSHPTGGSVPGDARYDGGATFGSGNNYSGGSAGGESTSATDSASVARGGATFGSGN